MRNNRNHNTSGVPGKRKAAQEQKDESLRRPEGTVNEHRKRVTGNAAQKEKEKVSGNSVSEE